MQRKLRMKGDALKKELEHFQFVQPIVFVLGDFTEPEPPKEPEPEKTFWQELKQLILKKLSS